LYLTSVQTSFAASHQLHGHQGPCRGLHGHTWNATVEVISQTVDEIGISIDFEELNKITESVISELDHHHLNDVPPFDKKNPTAENLAAYIYNQIKEALPSSSKIHRVTVWESENHSVTYSENEGA
jgi:6-pyruvoyltetrahydropterin/6-carboxytetrahydropterin synthase